MTTILGIDPGSRVTGYGFLREEAGKIRMHLCGTVRPANNLDLPGRLHAIHRDLRALIAEHEPEVVAVETAFYHKNVRSALVLGHVRGVVLLVAREAGLEVCEYTPRKVKMAVTGTGGAAKEQVAFMIRGLLGLNATPPADAADALAVALCHWHRSRLHTSL